MKRPLVLAAVVLAVGAVAWLGVQKLRGPALDGYQVAARPLVQTVVATGRVVAVSRAQVGSPVTGVVLNQVDIKKAQKSGYRYSGYYDYYGYSDDKQAKS